MGLITFLNNVGHSLRKQAHHKITGVRKAGFGEIVP
jgi:hypothetical protein